MLEFVIKVCYHTISILGDIRAKMQHNASRMSLSDLVISALGPTALVLISLDQKNSFSRHSAASMHSSSPSMLISADDDDDDDPKIFFKSAKTRVFCN